MGSELVSDSPPYYGGEPNNGSALITYSEQFYKHLPFYLAIGMTYDQYWNEDCTLVKYYREAHELKRREKNQELWMQGMYIYEALCEVAPVLRAFAKKGTKPLPYVSEPYPLSRKEIREREERIEKARYEKQVSKVLSWVKQVNTKYVNTSRKEGEELGR